MPVVSDICSLTTDSLVVNVPRMCRFKPVYYTKCGHESNERIEDSCENQGPGKDGCEFSKYKVDWTPEGELTHSENDLCPDCFVKSIFDFEQFEKDQQKE